ncbi:MAG: Clp1/GlmU family protein [Candidatus Bathyarchaeota archaeon]|jgi:polynucleotide 5'-hydroxyl-kinase GRC3/NOL9
MKHVVDEGKTLLVDGPASVSLISGKVTVLGAPLHVDEKVVVREGKRLPLFVKQQGTLEWMLGEGASVNEIDEVTVPSSWETAAKEILSLNKPVTVMVVGGIDSGKTSFCTFLVNEAVMNNWKTCVVDADLGQSDVGPPSTVGFTFVTEPVKDLFDIDAVGAVFVGCTSPSGALNKLVEALTQLKSSLIEEGVELLVINTDGWVEGEEASAYKVRLTEEVAPTAVVGMQRGNELTPILDALDEVKVFAVDSPQLIQPRSREKRKILRELSYKKYMKGAKLQSFSFGWMKAEGSIFGAGVPLSRRRLGTLSDLLRKRPIYSEETVAAIFAVLNDSQHISEEDIDAAEKHFNKRVKVIREGDEEGLLVGLKDEEDNFLGIGILNGVDYKRKLLKVYTPVNEKVSALCFGQVKLDKNCREIGLSTVYCGCLS